MVLIRFSSAGSFSGIGRCALSAVARFSSSFAADMMARTPPTTAPPMNAMMLNMLCNLQPKKSLGEINPPVVKFAGNAQPLGSLRVVAFKRLQEISGALGCVGALNRSEEHTSELQSLMRISYAVFCL